MFSHPPNTSEIIIPYVKSIIPLSHKENPLTLSMKFHETLLTCFNDKLDSNSSNVCDGDNNSLLHLAVRCSQPHLCRLLLHAGANVNHVNNQKNSCLIELFFNQNSNLTKENLNKIIEITNILIEYRADVNVKSSNGITVFQLASHIGNEKLMIALVSNYPHLSNFISNDFRTAFTNQWFKYAEILIKILPNNFLASNITNETFQQSKNVDPNLIKLLFDKSSSNLQKSILENLLYNAVNNDDTELFKHFIKIEILEPKLFKNGETLLTFLLKEKKIQFAWQLLESVNKMKFVNLKNNGNQYPFHVAIEIEEINIIDNLIHALMEINSKDIKKQLEQLLEKISNSNTDFKRKLISTIKKAIMLEGDIDKVNFRGQGAIDTCREKRDTCKQHTSENQSFDIGNNRNSQQVNNESNNQIGICKICMENLVDISFQCGHLCCAVCTDKLFNCPFCNREITHRTTIYFN